MISLATYLVKLADPNHEESPLEDLEEHSELNYEKELLKSLLEDSEDRPDYTEGIDTSYEAITIKEDELPQVSSIRLHTLV